MQNAEWEMGNEEAESSKLKGKPTNRATFFNFRHSSAL
jgi:hypothetical protein